MGRNRVLSFMSSFASNTKDVNATPTSLHTQPKYDTGKDEFPPREAVRDVPTTTVMAGGNPTTGSSPQPRAQRERAPSSSRPLSMVQTYQPPLMEVNYDTLPELQPIFTFLNSHSNKLYQEGYFLKLDDQNTQGRPNADRTWTECFAQLVGTVLSLWDAAELDAAGVDGEVLPRFINLTDASIKMIESLPTRSNNEAPLQNVLSISTAGKNRYLLHFNSHHSLIQWTAGIRLAMFEHATLQEAYTGALIAGKGKQLNNINTIMERSRLPTADWARVRFGAGTPWRRCWCVITPPDEKEVQKLQRQLKKKSAYDRTKPPVLKGDIKFYDTKKTKKVRPIATISDAYSAFAIYPQSKPLIDASTLVKVEGAITIHSNPPSTTEGFVFVMPEVHPAVTGFEMMLRWLFPVFDTFALYGRPGRLIAAIEDVRSLMFAMPKHRRYGYLEILDISGLILEPGSANWKESEWRRRMKELTGKRMLAIESGSRANSRYSSRRSTRNSFGPSRSRIHFDDGASIRSTPSVTFGQAQSNDFNPGAPPRTDSAPPVASAFATPPRSKQNPHHRSVSDTHGFDRLQSRTPPSNGDALHESAPTPPPHLIGSTAGPGGSNLRHMQELATTPERVSSEDERPGRSTPVRELQELQETTQPEPVAPPPAFAHAPGAMPISKPYQSPELRRANSRMSSTTLSQLAGAASAYDEGTRTSEDQRRQKGHLPADANEQGVRTHANTHEILANPTGPSEGLVGVSQPQIPLQKSSTARPPISTVQHDQPQLASETLANNIRYDGSHVNSTPLSVQDVSTSQPPSQIPLHNTASPYDVKPTLTHRISYSQTGSSIQRKPLPDRASSTTQSPAITSAHSTTASLGQYVVDQEALAGIGHDAEETRSTLQPEYHRQNSGYTSIYSDNDTTTSPNYASTRRSMDTRESMEKYRPEKPRAGVMKTVGTSQAPESSQAPISIDFGPTINYARTPSPGPAKGYARTNSPGPALNNFPVDRVPRGATPTHRPGSTSHSKSPNRKPLSTDLASRQEPRTMAWQPAVAASGKAVAQRALTPEEFVQQRASAVPLYSHQRQQSANTLSPPPNYSGIEVVTTGHSRDGSTDRLAQISHSRNASVDRLAQISHSQNGSTDMLHRPNSRGRSPLSSAAATNLPSSLSAREQEHLARATGQPLLNMANISSKAQPQGGLVGAIDARERDREALKQGMNNVAVQHAIAQRQQQLLSQQYAGQFRHDSYSQPAYLGTGPSNQPYPPANHMNFPLQVSAANAYAQGGGWSTPPAPIYSMQPEQGRQSPSSPQQFFTPPQQRPQSQGRGGMSPHRPA